MSSSRPSPTSTSFTVLSAVETWDSAFRWRENGQLQDLTIEDTWSRVSRWLAAAELASAPIWTQRFTEAFAGWQVLPDEVVLQRAGTGDTPRFEGAPLAVVNASVFAHRHGHRPARIDSIGLAASAALAVRMLDDAMVLTGGVAEHDVRIGLIGMADALNRLDMPFVSAAAADCAREVARALLRGSLQGAVDLALERGEGRPVPDELLAHWREIGIDLELLDAAARHGLRRIPIVGLHPAPRLAQLANGIAEGSNPAQDTIRPRHDAGCFTDSTAAEIAAVTPCEACLLSAQLRLRSAMQPWLAAVIDAPLIADAAPSPECWRSILALAAQLGLPEPRWRIADPGRKDDTAAIA